MTLKLLAGPKYLVLLTFQKWVKRDGLSFLLWANANSLPSSKEPAMKVGFEQVTDKYRAKLLVGTKDLIADLQATYLFCPKHILLGTNLVADLKG